MPLSSEERTKVRQSARRQDLDRAVARVNFTIAILAAEGVPSRLVDRRAPGGSVPHYEVVVREPRR